MPHNKILPPLHRNKKDTTGYIYIFSIGHDDLYKIGKSNNWSKRLKTLQAGNPDLKAILIVHVRNRHTAEKAAHGAVISRKVGREVYRLYKTDIEMIERVLEGYKI